MAIRYLRRPPKPRSSSREVKRDAVPVPDAPPAPAASVEAKVCVSCGRVHVAGDLCSEPARPVAGEAASGGAQP